MSCGLPVPHAHHRTWFGLYVSAEQERNGAGRGIAIAGARLDIYVGEHRVVEHTERHHHFSCIFIVSFHGIIRGYYHRVQDCLLTIALSPSNLHPSSVAVECYSAPTGIPLGRQKRAAVSHHDKSGHARTPAQRAWQRAEWRWSDRPAAARSPSPFAARQRQSSTLTTMCTAYRGTEH